MTCKIKKFERHCICGNGMEGEVDERGYDKIMSAWEQVHSGEGHRPCTAQEAAAELQRQEAHHD